MKNEEVIKSIALEARELVENRVKEQFKNPGFKRHFLYVYSVYSVLERTQMAILDDLVPGGETKQGEK